MDVYRLKKKDHCKKTLQSKFFCVLRNNHLTRLFMRDRVSLSTFLCFAFTVFMLTSSQLFITSR